MANDHAALLMFTTFGGCFGWGFLLGGKGAQKGSWKPKPIDDEEVESIDYVENSIKNWMGPYQRTPK